MKTSRRKLCRQKPKPATLNLVSLMDIFTILVFFLMVNSSDVEVLESASDVALPMSIESQVPEERLLISISKDELSLGGESIASVKSILSTETVTIAALHKVLSEMPEEVGGQVTIMGDRSLPYELVKKIMRTCQESRFTQIALAVNQVEAG